MHHVIDYGEDLAGTVFEQNIASSTGENKKLTVKTLCTTFGMPDTRFVVYHGGKAVFSTMWIKGAIAVYNGITCTPERVKQAINVVTKM